MTHTVHRHTFQGRTILGRFSSYNDATRAIVEDPQVQRTPLTWHKNGAERHTRAGMIAYIIKEERP